MEASEIGQEEIAHLIRTKLAISEACVQVALNSYATSTQNANKEAKTKNNLKVALNTVPRSKPMNHQFGSDATLWNCLVKDLNHEEEHVEKDAVGQVVLELLES